MSLLSELSGTDFGPTSKVTKAFASALNATLSQQSGKPQLIVLGDLLDLQFSNRAVAAQSAISHLKALYDGGQLHPELIATAGNHDHALWTDARLSIEADHAATLATDGSSQRDIIDYRRITPAFSKDTADSRLLTAVARAAGFETVDLRYPNIAFGDTGKCVFLHHGHFIERPYRAMSLLQDFLLGSQRTHLTAEEIATENAGWLDFFWSALGETALRDPGYDIYQSLLTVTGYRAKSAEWSTRIAEHLSDILPLSGNVTLQGALRRLTQVGFDSTLEAFADSERIAIVKALTEDGWTGLKWYLDGAVRQQIHDELSNTGTPTDQTQKVRDLTFVFGHTHKSFSDMIVSDASTQPTKVFNTGGWVLNGPQLDNEYGAAMVMIDDALNVVSVRLFSTPHNGVVPKVRVDTLSGASEDGQAFANDVQAWINGASTEWEELRQEVHRAYEQRQAYLLDATAGASGGRVRAS